MKLSVSGVTVLYNTLSVPLCHLVNYFFSFDCSYTFQLFRPVVYKNLDILLISGKLLKFQKLNIRTLG